MQIGRMGFARVEREDHALALEVHFHISHSGNPLQHRSQFAHALIAIFPFSRDFDRFQDGIAAALPKKWIGRIGISRSCRVHRVLIITQFNVQSERIGRLPDHCHIEHETSQTIAVRALKSK